MNRIAWLTQISDTEYEVFHILTMPDEASVIYLKWKEIIESNQYSIEKYENVKNLLYWRDEINQSFHESLLTDAVRGYCLVSNNIIYGASIFKIQSTNVEKFDAALSNHVILLVLEDGMDVDLADIWNGSSFIKS